MDKQKTLNIQLQLLFKIFDLWYDNTNNQHYDNFAIASAKFKEDLDELYYDLLNEFDSLESGINNSNVVEEE